MNDSLPAGLREKAELTIATSEKNAAILRAFIQNYPADGIPGKVFGTEIASEKPSVVVYMFLAPDDAGRDKLLGHIGAAWGTDGWERSDSHTRDKYDWSKELDGVRLRIHQAETLERISTPVPPSKFPLLLAEEGGAAQ